MSVGSLSPAPLRRRPHSGLSLSGWGRSVTVQALDHPDATLPTAGMKGPDLGGGRRPPAQPEVRPLSPTLLTPEEHVLPPFNVISDPHRAPYGCFQPFRARSERG